MAVLPHTVDRGSSRSGVPAGCGFPPGCFKHWAPRGDPRRQYTCGCAWATLRGSARRRRTPGAGGRGRRGGCSKWLGRAHFLPAPPRRCPVLGALGSGGPQAGGPGAAAAQEPPLPPLRPRWPRGALQPAVRPRCAAAASAVLGASPALSSRGPTVPGSALLSLRLLQLILGCCMVALSFGALSLSSSPQVKNSCRFWAGSSVILSGIIGLTTWRRPMILL
ncbi:uncharacterized protein LOC115072668, partial [Nannospalax galili]|uniref:uncharacterized protein LOC115072668 n=1 Tax=Nannospalax galili TaxID=1026970 RepID=UPI00111BF18A